VCQYLLKRGANVNIKTTSGVTPLDLARNLGRTDIIELLEKYVNVNPLTSSSSNNTNFYQLTPEEHTKYYRAISIASIEQLTEFLKTHTPFNINCIVDVRQAPSSLGKTALHLACAKESGNSPLVKFLLKNNARVDISDTQYWTPLHCASNSGNLELVELLLKHGSDFNAITTDGTTCLHYLVRNPDSERLMRTIDLLLKSNADINALNKYNETPLHLAATYGRAETVRFLLKKGANPSIPNSKGRTPLQQSAAQHRNDILEIFLEDLRSKQYLQRSPGTTNPRLSVQEDDTLNSIKEKVLTEACAEWNIVYKDRKQALLYLAVMMQLNIPFK
jgi:ankyrin